MSFTDGLSFSRVTNLLRSGSLDRWRVASSGSVRDLFLELDGISAGFNPFSQGWSADNLEVLQVYNLIGETDASPGVHGYARGYVNDFTSSLNTDHFSIAIGWYSGYPNSAYYTYGDEHHNNDVAASRIGTWVVRDHAVPVSVPAILWLFGSGLIGLVGMRKNHNK